MDYLGTADYLTSPMTGKVESWTQYNEWGEITHNAVLKSGQRQFDMVKRYATHDYDQVLGMYYAKARFYDAENRKFTAIDPILDGSIYDIANYAKHPELLVQYLYVKNNPIIYIDPDGLRYVIDDLDIHGINAAKEKEKESQKKIDEDKLFNYLYNRPGHNNIYLKRIAPPATTPEIKLGPVIDYTNYIEKCTKKTDYTIPTILAIDSGDKNVDIAYTKWWDNRPIEEYEGDPRYTLMTVASFQNLLLRMSTKGTDVSKLSVAELNKLFDGELNAQGEATMAMFGAAVAISKNIGSTVIKTVSKEGANDGPVIIGETMKRVEMEAAKHPNAKILNDMPDYWNMGLKDYEVTSKMMAYNRKWILDQLRSGREIIDIGLDPARKIPSIFYQMEQNMIKNFIKLHP